MFLALISGGLATGAKRYHIWGENMTYDPNEPWCFAKNIGAGTDLVSEGCVQIWALLAGNANYVYLGDQEVFGRQGKKESNWMDYKNRRESCLGENLANTWNLCLFFSWNRLMCWQQLLAVVRDMNICASLQKTRASKLCGRNCVTLPL